MEESEDAWNLAKTGPIWWIHSDLLRGRMLESKHRQVAFGGSTMDATKVCLNLIKHRQVPFGRCTQFRPNMMEELGPTQFGLTIMEDALNLAKTG